MKTPDFIGTRAGHLLMGANKIGFRTMIALASLLLMQTPCLSEQVVNHRQTSLPVANTRPPSRDDILIVQLAQGVDRDQFNELLQDVHGTFVRTIEFGPTLKFQVILSEPGQAAQLEKQLKNNKEITQVQRNTIYKIKNDVAVAQHAGGMPHVHAVRSTVKIGHGFGHGRGSFPTTPTAAQPPVSTGGPLSGSSTDPYSTAQWDLAMMNFNQARDSGAPYATPVPMYFCDTGYTVNADSPYSVVQYNFSDPINPGGGQESIFDAGTHGTETATVAAYSDNATGFTGVANLSGQRIMLYELRISADGQSAGLVNILAALSSLANNPGFLPGTVNLSFNLPPPDSLNGNPSVQQAALQLVQRGFLLVLASGNDGMYDPSPEQYLRRVAAVTGMGTLTSYSNSGAFNTAAPGESVACYTPAGGTSETFDSGTSFAAPRWCAAVTVVMGIMQPGNRSAVNADLIIRQTGNVNGQGFIIPNLNAAVQYAMGSP
jgi:hypothetical protein